MSAEPIFEFNIDTAPAAFIVTRVDGSERLHAPFRLLITGRFAAAPGEDDEIDIEALLGSPARLAIKAGDTERVLAGVLDRVEAIARGHRLILVPRIAALASSVDHRVFVDKDTLEIVEEILTDHGVPLEKRVERALPKRPQCVQMFESDLDFITRLLSEDGIAFHVDCTSGEDVVVVADRAGAYTAISGDQEVPFDGGEASGLGAAEAIFEASLSAVVASDAITLQDYDFERPRIDQAAEAGSGSLLRYEYPGGHRDPSLGKVLAAIRLEEAQRERVVLSGRSTCRRLAVGAIVRLSGAPRDDMNGRWLLIELAYTGVDDGAAPNGESRRYVADFVAVPAEQVYRPARTRAPSMFVQTATVTGPAGTEIHTDAHGRLTTLFRWDRRRPKDDTSSQWMRPVQPPTSGGLFLPRVGWEVLLIPSRDSMDVPYEMGRLHNAEAPPPEALPGKKVRSVFGSSTTPGGGSANVLRLDDTAGSEAMSIEASRDYRERTENDKVTTIQANDDHSVGSNHKEIVGIQQHVKIDGAQAYSVGASRALSVGGNLVLQAADESVTVGGLRSFSVGGDFKTKVGGTLVRGIGGAKAEVATLNQNLHVSGVSRVAVGGARIEGAAASAGVSVLGASSLTVGGAYTIAAPKYALKAGTLKEDYGALTVDAGGKINDSFSGAATYSVGGSLALSGSAVIFKASGKITIRGAGATVTITPGSIDIDAVFDSGEDLVVSGMDINE